MNDDVKVRSAHRKRTTKETEIEARLAIDGEGSATVDTGIGFLDHMLELFTYHSAVDLQLKATGDLHVDCHHTVEDVALVLGECVGEALGDKSGVQRFGSAYVPLDESLSRVVIDLSGRPYLQWKVAFTSDRVGDFPTELFEDFFRAFSDRARVTLHVETLHGTNNHHIIETVFKAFARSFRQAVELGGKRLIPSTKGTLRD